MKESIGRIITLLSREINMSLKEVVEPFGITVGEEPYFMALVHEDGISQERLSSIVCVDKAATARAVSSLEGKGFIRREINPEDKRNKKLYLTAKGKKIYPELKEKLAAYNEKLTASWSEEQYDLVYSLLEQLQRNIQEK